MTFNLKRIKNNIIHQGITVPVLGAHPSLENSSNIFGKS
jgi:hypothetical protein